ncbi:MAG TPA: TIM barrel protein [Gemmatimonadaceae bacterium]|nr:TIM barrel protein [Gemmatimonadaceae bacterium]
MIRLAISNIAWEPPENDAVATVLRTAGLCAVELAPTKWKEAPLTASLTDIACYRKEWEWRELHVVAMQALLFGRPELQLFGEESSRTAMLDYLKRIVELGAGLGAKAFVLGSPKNRARGNTSPADAMKIAEGFFTALGEHAQQHSATICVEANPPAYDCDFITSTAEAVELCRRVSHPAVRVNVDLGGITMNGEDPARAIHTAAEFIGHFHASEPNLQPLGAQSDHRAAAAALVEIGYDKCISIEMRAVGEGKNVVAVEAAVKCAKDAYAPVLSDRRSGEKNS